MHKTHIFDQKNKAKKNVANLPTLFFSDRYRKQTIFFSWPNKKVTGKINYGFQTINHPKQEASEDIDFKGRARKQQKMTGHNSQTCLHR